MRLGKLHITGVNPDSAHELSSVDVDDVDDNLTCGLLETTGNRVKFRGGSNRFGGARTINASALSGNGLLDDGARVQTNVTVGGSAKAGAITNGGGYVQHTFNDGQTRVWIDAWLQVTYAPEALTPDPDAVAAFYVAANGQVMVFDGEDDTPEACGLTAPEGEWVRFTVFCDYVATRWILYVNGVQTRGFRFHDPTITSFSKCKASGSTTYIDDLTISTERPDLPWPPSLILVK